MKKLFLFVFIVTCFHIKAQSQLSSSSLYLDSIIQHKMELGHIPGLSACIVKDGQIRWIGNYGQAYFEPDIPVDTSTLFMLASISKTPTVTALMQLWEDGLFNLDDDINDYMPFEVHNPYYPDDTITFRMLCTHTSAIKDNWNLMTYYWGEDSPIPLGQYLYDYMHPDGANYSQSLNYYNLEPGTAFHYCNNAVALIGYLIELIGDSTFSYQTHDRVFEPLQMNETAWFISELDTMNFAMPYHWNATTYVPYGHFSYSDYPAGALRTSIDQLALFLMCYMEGGSFQGQQILQSSTVEMMLTPQIPEIYPDMGLIWFQSKSGDRELWGHTGGDIGVRTLFSFCQDENTGVVVLTNGENNNTNKQIEEILYQYAEDSIITTSAPALLADVHTDLFTISPNPCSNVARLYVTRHASRVTSIDLYSISGTRIEHLADGVKMPGEYEIEINVSALPAGVYFIKLQAGQDAAVQKLIVVD